MLGVVSPIVGMAWGFDVMKIVVMVVATIDGLLHERVAMVGWHGFTFVVGVQSGAM